MAQLTDISTLYETTSPLSSNQYTFYKYPKDLGSDGQDHYVIFFINVPNLSSDNTPENTNRNLPAPTINANYQYDLNSKAPTANLKQPITRTNAAIALYMPTIVDGLTNNWESKDLGVTGALAKDMRDTTGSWMDKLKSTVGDVTNSIVGDLLKGIDNKFGADTKDLAQGVMRVAQNPHSEVLFQGINFRRFSFDFEMTPRDEDEAVTIEKIIRMLRRHSAPELQQDKLLGRYWVYPSEFDIKFYSNGAENTFLNKISTCALTDIVVDYAPGGRWIAYTEGNLMNGAPVSVRMSLSFVELELLSKTRIDQGF